MRKGRISSIERFSLHDGPGIRTLVIMKGCPLRCSWCSSPHTQAPHPELLYIREKCSGCGQCIEVCPQKAISKAADAFLVKTDRTVCTGCGECESACPNRAREIWGRQYTAEALFREVERDAAFYRRSGGGITVGGGEPTVQAGFVEEFLARCKSHFFHTAIETCAFAPWERLALLLPHLDLVHIDLKNMDETRHVEGTGASNSLILENIERVATRCPLVLRVPVIPGFNDSAENIRETAEFANTLGDQFLRLELLPYHPFGVHRYQELERAYKLEFIETPSAGHMEELRDIARSAGVDVEIGG